MKAAELLTAKLLRSRELVDDVVAEIERFESSEALTFRTERHPDEPRLDLFVTEVRAPPLRLGVLIGDLAHNLRSVLDHLVWQLALTNVPEPHGEHQYPIYTKRPDWPGVVGRRLREVSPAAVALIEATQPYHAKDPQNDPLAVVQWLNNEDKHRLVHQTLSLPMEPTPDGVLASGNMDIAEDIDVELYWGAPLRVGARAMTVRYVPLGPNPSIKIEANVPHDLLCGSRGLKASMLPELVNDIEAQVARFSGFFE